MSDQKGHAINSVAVNSKIIVTCLLDSFSLICLETFECLLDIKIFVFWSSLSTKHDMLFRHERSFLTFEYRACNKI